MEWVKRHEKIFEIDFFDCYYYSSVGAGKRENCQEQCKHDTA